MAKITQTKGGKFGVDVYVSGKRIRKVVSKNRHEAEALLKLLEKQNKSLVLPSGEIKDLATAITLLAEALLQQSIAKAPNMPQQTSLSQLTWGQLFHKWIIDYQKSGKSKGSVKRHHTSFNALSQFFEDLLIVDVNRDMIVEYFRIRRIEKSVNTIKNELDTLSQSFDYALARGIIKENPVLEAKKLKYLSNMTKGSSQVGKAYSNDELRSLFFHAEDWVLNHAWISLNTGMRKKAVESLKFEQIDLFKGVIRLESEQTKTRQSRFVYLNDHMIRYFKSKMKIRSLATSYVCFNPHTKKPYRDVTHGWSKVCKKAKVTGRFHDLRHTYATRVKQVRQIDDSVASKLVGHVNTKTTDIYTHHEAEYLKAIANEVGKTLDFLLCDVRIASKLG